ncbi:MAG: hypothetical protein R3B13_07755 [Polyangiaceae bacterium]
MHSLTFEIRHPDGRADEVRVDGERALIGCGAHCEIRLPVGSAEIEHVALEVTPGGLVVEARSFQPPPTINNAPFTRAMLTPGAILGIGYTQIGVTVQDLAGAAAAQKKENSLSPTTLVLAALIAVVGAFLIFTDPNDEETQDQPREVPELFPAAPKSCPQSGPSALAYAEDRASVGYSKRERRPFHVNDGVAAVPEFEMASVCYAAAGDKAASQELARVAASLREEVAQDFRTHRVRLEYALNRKNWEVAQKEVRVLLEYLEGQQHDYVNWLSNIDRRIRLKYGNDQRKKK